MDSHPDAGRARPLRAGVAVPLLAAVLWAIHPLPSFGAMVVAYGVAWLLLSVARLVAPRLLALRLSRAQWITLMALLAAGPVARLVAAHERLGEYEHLEAADVQLAARHRLEDTPSIAPPLVSWDLPQTFYVHAPGAARVRVSLTEDRPLDTEALGHGLFRLEYDPRRDGRGEGSGTVDVRLEVDGVGHRRAMTAVEALAHPRWLSVSPDGRALAASSEETDALIGFDAEGLRFVVDTDDGPTAPCFLDDARVAVAHRYGEALSVFDASSGAVLETLPLGAGARHLALSPDGTELVVSRDRELVVVGLAPLAVRERVALDFAPDWVAYGPDRDTLITSARYPADLHRLRRHEGHFTEDVRPLGLLRPAVTLARGGDGRRVVIATTDHQAELRAHLGNHYVLDQLLEVDVERWRVDAHTATATRTTRQDSPGNVDRGVSPMGIHVAADGGRLVAFAGTDDVLRVDPTGSTRRFVLDGLPVHTPISAAPLADGGFAVSSAAAGAIGLFGADGELRRLLQLAPSDDALLRDDQRALQRRIGERSFYESTRAGVSCQSCHLHAGSDQSRHNIGGSTLVATLDVRGALGTPPYLRDGGYPFLGSLHELSVSLYRGYRRTQGGRTVSLDRYLSDLPREPPRRQLGLGTRDLTRERRGLDAFITARCPVCHAFPAFTNLGQHPPRAVFEGFEASLPSEQLDTPTLLGLGTSAPYLVDGRAVTLDAIFEDHDPAHRHGDMARLRPAERDDLLFLLEDL